MKLGNVLQSVLDGFDTKKLATDEIATPSGRVAMVWMRVKDLEGRPFYVRQVRALEKGIELVQWTIGKAVTCGWDYSFVGRHLSTKAQVRLMYAYLKGQGIEVV